MSRGQQAKTRGTGLDWVQNHARFKRQRVINLLREGELPAKLISERLDVSEDVVLRIAHEERIRLPSWHGFFTWTPA